MTTRNAPAGNGRVSPTAPQSRSTSANVWGLLEGAPGFEAGMERAKQDFAAGRVERFPHKAPRPKR